MQCSMDTGTLGYFVNRYVSRQNNVWHNTDTQ